MYDLAALDAALAGTSFADKLHFSALTSSTNNDALAAARVGAAHGSVFFADAQDSGKGRGGHGWASAPGEGLYVSVVLRPAVALERWPLLPFCAGLAVVEAVRETTGIAADLRWPNDVLLGARKLCGILVEAGKDAAENRFAVAGIGINVHQRAFAGELAALATSLDLEAGGCVSRQKLLVALLQSLERETGKLADSCAIEEISARVERSSSWVRGRSVAVHGPQACQGVTAGLDAHGFLRVETAAGIVTVQTGGIRAREVD